ARADATRTRRRTPWHTRSGSRRDVDVCEASVLGADAEQVLLAALELQVRVRHAYLVHLDAALFDEPFSFARRFDQPRAREGLRDPERRAVGRDRDGLDVVRDRVGAVDVLELDLRRDRRCFIVEACDQLLGEERFDLPGVAAFGLLPLEVRDL